VSNELSVQYLGRVFCEEELVEIRDIVKDCSGLSRNELANTVCELFTWKRQNGRLKTMECRQLLDYLDENGLLQLPKLRNVSTKERKKGIVKTSISDPNPPVTGSVRDVAPVTLVRVDAKEARQLWYEYVDRYHYLGYRIPFGASLRYFIESAQGERTILGCLQFSSAAWRMAPRDNWIGWDDQQRTRNLQRIVNNSRFLLLPWVQVRNLASYVLSLLPKILPRDWNEMYGYDPVLLETLVDTARFRGTCYRAANWIHLGTTTGRGRMDEHRRKDGLIPKEIFVYPLSPKFRKELLS
jgi:hypothetical protein